jgi:CHAT domain-containing protein
MRSFRSSGSVRGAARKGCRCRDPACESGLGAVAQGEGVLGLQRGFAIAGAQALVMTLWSGPDAETNLLMQDFYGQLLYRRRALPPAEALREAQLAALARARETTGQANPGQWGAFAVSTRLQ